ncbi:hypothetical protein K470DRAFT_264738 [Piedraia hortae CBS 480.64]|uniref:Fucose-specific lectin n=1 Tax=Piedraia hortae CBS 480.64 TaxID=1314780 RepID=A0A6A7C001_9PEZI|nr:hypothetical protein K470DRAFT_264738 [Piedraia hortae CBS 480.64]
MDANGPLQTRPASTHAPIPVTSEPAEKETDLNSKPAEKELDPTRSGPIPVEESSEKEVVNSNTYQDHSTSGTSSGQPRNRKRIFGLPSLCFALLVLLLLATGLSVGLGVALSRKKSSHPPPPPPSPTSTSITTPSPSPSSTSTPPSSTSSTSTLPTAKHLNCASNPPSGRKALNGTGLAFATLSQNQTASSTQTLANLYYSDEETLRVHQLWGNGSWTDNPLPIHTTIFSKSPLAALATTKNNTILWNLFFIDKTQAVQHLTYADPGFTSHATALIDDMSYNRAFADSRAYIGGETGLVVCPAYPNPHTQKEGMVLWYTSNSMTLWQWEYRSDWKPIQTEIKPLEKGVGCYTKVENDVVNLMTVNSSASSWQFYREVFREGFNSSGLEKCEGAFAVDVEEEFLRNDGGLFFVKDGQGGVWGKNLKTEWDCDAFPRGEGSVRVGEKVMLSEGRLDAGTVYNGSGTGDALVFFQDEEGVVLGYERREGGNWVGGVDVLQC